MVDEVMAGAGVDEIKPAGGAGAGRGLRAARGVPGPPWVVTAAGRRALLGENVLRHAKQWLQATTSARPRPGKRLAIWRAVDSSPWATPRISTAAIKAKATPHTTPGWRAAAEGVPARPRRLSNFPNLAALARRACWATTTTNSPSKPASAGCLAGIARATPKPSAARSSPANRSCRHSEAPCSPGDMFSPPTTRVGTRGRFRGSRRVAVTDMQQTAAIKGRPRRSSGQPAGAGCRAPRAGCHRAHRAPRCRPAGEAALPARRIASHHSVSAPTWRRRSSGERRRSIELPAWSSLRSPTMLVPSISSVPESACWSDAVTTPQHREHDEVARPRTERRQHRLRHRGRIPSARWSSSAPDRCTGWLTTGWEVMGKVLANLTFYPC